MRLMMKGDMAFFYHSNCKVPGIVGTMEIVEEHSVDSKFPYFWTSLEHDSLCCFLKIYISSFLFWRVSWVVSTQYLVRMSQLSRFNHTNLF